MGKMTKEEREQRKEQKKKKREQRREDNKILNEEYRLKKIKDNITPNQKYFKEQTEKEDILGV